MKNNLYIDMLNGCECTLVSATDDKTARVILYVTCDSSLNPKIEIVGSRTVSIPTNKYIVELTAAEMQGTGTLQFRFVDDTHTGNYFNITKAATLDETLYLEKIDNFNYSLKCKTVEKYYTQAEVDALLKTKYDTESVVNLTINEDYFEAAATNFAFKKGNVCQLQLYLNLKKAYTAWSSVVIGTLPVGYRPKTGVAKVVRFDSFIGALRIQTNGSIELQTFNGAVGNFLFENVMYII